MILKFQKKEEIVLKAQNTIKKHLIIILLSFKKISSNEINYFRRDFFKKNFFIFVTRNNLFKIIFKKINIDILKKFFFQTTMIVCSKKDYTIFKLVDHYLQKYKDKLFLKAIYINKKLTSDKVNKKLVIFSDITQAMFYFIFLIKNLSILRLLNLLNIIKEQKL